VPRFRFTIRWMMVVVAIVAIGLFGSIEYLRLSRVARMHRFRARVHFASSLNHSRVSRSFLEQAEPPPVGSGNSEAIPGLRRVAALEGALAGHYSRLTAKYERAARYPWLPVAPDPPEPE
jgi:hypothetical protein